jgi:hypothetical protein
MNLLLTFYPTRALLANSSVMYHAFLDEESHALIADPAALGSKRCDVSCVNGKGGWWVSWVIAIFLHQKLPVYSFLNIISFMF